MRLVATSTYRSRSRKKFHVITDLEATDAHMRYLERTDPRNKGEEAEDDLEHFRVEFATTTCGITLEDAEVENPLALLNFLSYNLQSFYEDGFLCRRCGNKDEWQADIDAMKPDAERRRKIRDRAKMFRQSHYNHQAKVAHAWNAVGRSIEKQIIEAAEVAATNGETVTVQIGDLLEALIEE